MVEGKLHILRKLSLKVSKRVMGWHNKILSFGRRYVLIANVLQSMPVYILSAMDLPNGVIHRLH